MSIIGLLTLLAISGCSFISDAELDARLDGDSDGVPRPTDCDDDDAALGGPGAWYGDADGDGFGAGSATEACAAPVGFVASGDDCDDTERDVNPDATEVCNGMDDDCVSGVDEDGAVDAPTWFADADADTFGDANAPRVTCYQPDGYVSDASDCDDADSAISPDAVEVCDGATVDEDCSGAPDLDCDGDGFDDEALGGDDCDDADPSIRPGVQEVCGDDIDNDCDGEIAGSCTFSGSYSLDDAPVRIDGAEHRGAAGWSLSVADFDGDGHDDIAFGLYGGVAVMAGPFTADATLDDAVSVVQDDVGSTEDLVAHSDIDGDGYQDLLISPLGEDQPAIYYGPVSVGLLTLSTADAVFRGPADASATDLDGGTDLDGDGYEDAAVLVTDYPAAAKVDILRGGPRGLAEITHSIGIQMQVGTVGTGGDIDGDGVSDLVIGSYASYSIWVMLDPTHQGTVDDADARLYAYDGYWIANDLAIADDVNGDGYGDVIECSSHSLSSGETPRVHVLEGPLSGDLTFADAAATFTLGAQGQSCSVSASGDLDGDGHQDILVGNEEGGVAYVLLSPLSGAVDASAADATLTASSSSALAGYDVVSGGDLDADGFDDALVGEPCAGDEPSCPSERHGSVYLLFGGAE